MTDIKNEDGILRLCLHDYITMRIVLWFIFNNEQEAKLKPLTHSCEGSFKNYANYFSKE